MSLPLIVDVAIGLVFIYLILSLLASEIQELLTTLLQWRAKHLKESIEMLLSGNVDEQDLPEEIERTRQLANQLYNHPLISSLNYRKRGALAMALRNVVQIFSFGTSQVPGAQPTGPSYIPASTFASSVLDMLQVNRVVRELHQDQLLKYQERLVQVCNESWPPGSGPENNLPPSLNLSTDRLLKIIDSIFQDFQQGQTSLELAFGRIHQELQTYLDSHQTILTGLPDEAAKKSLGAFLSQVQQVQGEIYLETDLDPQTQQPTGRQRGKWLSRDAVTVPQVFTAYRELKDALTNPDSPMFQKLDNLNGAIHQKIKTLPLQQAANAHGEGSSVLDLLQNIPDNLLNSLALIAVKTQNTVANMEDQITHLGQEIGHWFDNGMERAGGVYKRNAKGVAFLIGLFLAIVANVDTFFVATQLAQDTVLREAIVSQAEKTGSLEEAKEIKGDFNSLGLELPIGWGETTLKDQAEARAQATWLGWPRQMLGWVVSGIAISMGAPFWFDLLGRLVNVRNTGRRNEKKEDKS